MGRKADPVTTAEKAVLKKELERLLAAKQISQTSYNFLVQELGLG